MKKWRKKGVTSTEKDLGTSKSSGTSPELCSAEKLADTVLLEAESKSSTCRSSGRQCFPIFVSY